MAKLQVLMPMGGLGSRFTKEGYKTPKPLIEVDGKPMFMRALDSFAPVKNIQYIFVIRAEQEKKYNLAGQIKSQIPEAKICILDYDTRGAVETCLIASDQIEDNIPICIADCDIYFESAEYFEKALSPSPPDGMLLTFQSSDPRYSYVRTDEDGDVIETAEKIVISNHAIIGGYYFSSGKLFNNVALEFVSQPLPESIQEYYLSHLFNLLLKRGLDVQIAEIEKKYIFGTPEELRSYVEREQ